LSKSEAGLCTDINAVDGTSMPVDNLAFLALYIGSASTLAVVAVVAAVCVKHVERRKEK